MKDEMNYFTSSLVLDEHPMIKVKHKLKLQYFIVLKEFVRKQMDNKYTAARLEQYRIKILNDSEIVKTDDNIEYAIKTVVNRKFYPWRKKYRYWLMCDIALILMDDDMIQNAGREMMSYMTKRQRQQFEEVLRILKDDGIDINSFPFLEKLILQYRRNRRFVEQPIRKFIVTANMSAGKSTLINALIGKSLARTSQEACTGNICYMFNKPFEDDFIHLKNESFSMNANQTELNSVSWDTEINISAYFSGVDDIQQRVCIIDTPGVNSAMNRKHGKISREALRSELYEKVIYILGANKLGTDEEITHIKWISENIPRDKVIFVLNKLDHFNTADDDIFTSINGVRSDLASVGFENPIICPMSAYFSYLIKLKSGGYEMSEDEIDEYALYTKKFKKPEYDLSRYYDNVQENPIDSEFRAMSKKCGLYGLEKILFGGTL